MKGWVYLLAISLGLPVAHAAEIAVPGSITLEQAIDQVLENSPRLRAAEYEARAAAARTKQARFASPFKVNIDLENIAGTGVAGDGDAMESTLSLARVLESGDKPVLRGDVAQQEAHLLQNEQDAQRLDLLAETAQHFVDVVTGQERLLIANDAVELARRVQAAVERRVRAGKTPAVERRRAAIAFARSELELKHAERGLAASRLKLATMWGETSPAFSTAQARLFALEPVEDFRLAEQLLERNPDLVQFATRQRLAETRIRLAEARSRPDIEVSGGARYLGLTDDIALVLGASIPLGSNRRAAPAIEEARLASLREPLDYEQRRLALHATLFEIHQELSQAYTAAEVLRNRIIPDAGNALRDYEKGYAAGRYSLLELTDAQRVLLDARLDAVMAASNYHRYQIEKDRLTGAAMAAGATP